MFPEGGGATMSTEEERALVLRRIAASGYSIWDDQDGSTANTLLEIAESIAPISPPPAHRKRGFLYTSLRRVYLRLKLRAKLRWLGLVPILAVLWAVVEVRVLAAQAPADSLIMTLLVRQVIGEWQDGVLKPYCITWHAERADRPRLLFLLDAVAADTTHTPLCGNAEGAYPVLLDAPTCPPDHQVNVTDRAWIIVRCGPNEFARYRRTFGVKRT
jgi:hypothetical protein